MEALLGVLASYPDFLAELIKDNKWMAYLMTGMGLLYAKRATILSIRPAIDRYVKSTPDPEDDRVWDIILVNPIVKFIGGAWKAFTFFYGVFIALSTTRNALVKPDEALPNDPITELADQKKSPQ